MPWIKDDYIASSYVKEDLPTWNEVYNDWYNHYKGNRYLYVPNDMDEYDTYWRIPKKKFLIAAVCNQFNKMIFEDGFKFDNEKLIKTIPEEIDVEGFEIIDIRFKLLPQPDDVGYYQKEITEFPPIYTFRNPNGILNPFINKESLAKRKRLYVDDFCKMELSYSITLMKGEEYIYITSHESPYTMKEFMNEIMNPYSSYFENGVGWKDENGNIIDAPKVVYNRSTDSAL